MGRVFVTLPGVWITWLFFLDTAERVDGDGVEMLGGFLLAGMVLTFLAGHASMLMQDYEGLSVFDPRV